MKNYKHLIKITLAWLLPTIAIVSFVVWGVIPWLSTKISPIEIEPHEIAFTEQPWQLSTSFYVQNRTMETWSAVWIKVSVNDNNIKTSEIFIDSKDGQDTPWEETISNIYINYSYVRMDGTDSKGKACIYFVIHHLNPQATQSFIIKIEPKMEMMETENPRLLLEIVSCSKEPVRILSQDGEIAYIFTPPEGFTIKSVSFKMHKE